METLLMSTKERRRLAVLSKVKEGRMTRVEASKALGLSYRQVLRVYERYRGSGDQGLIHRLRGRASNHATDATQRQAVLELCRDKYAGFGPTLAVQYLHQEEGYDVTAATLRRWMLQEGLWRKRRQRPTHRQWRPRRSCRGELVQMDGSHHDWFEGRGPWCVLMVMVDDATNFTYARFFEAETTAAAYTMMERYVARHGRPLGLYVDKDSIYKVNREATADENLAHTGPLTQFGRAMSELDIELICAHSPQAKGRVERMNGTLQDRLVKAMRLKGIGDLESANDYLERHFLADHNARFMVEPASQADVHRPLERGMELREILCWQERRVVNKDWTVSWKDRWLQVEACEPSLGLARQAVTVRQRMDGSLALLFKGRQLKWKELPSRPVRIKPQLARPGKTSIPWKPPVDHPWRNGGPGRNRVGVESGGGSEPRSPAGAGSAPGCSPTARIPALRPPPPARITPM